MSPVLDILVDHRYDGQNYYCDNCVVKVLFNKRHIAEKEPGQRKKSYPKHRQDVIKMNIR